MTIDEIRKLIREIADFPTPGILFRDITPLISNARGFAATVDMIAERYLAKVDYVLGIESRGFIIGAPVAYRLGVGLSIARKPGKLPGRTIDESYLLEYGSAVLQMHAEEIPRGARVLVVDDLLATGGTAEAAIRLARRQGGEVLGCAFIIELRGLKGRERLHPTDCYSLIQYD